MLNKVIKVKYTFIYVLDKLGGNVFKLKRRHAIEYNLLNLFEMHLQAVGLIACENLQILYNYMHVV